MIYTLYQPLLIGERPYHAVVGNVPGFREHRHPEIEISYCVKGSYDIIINKELYHICEDDVAIISSMTSHKFPQNSNRECIGLTIMVGPAFLSKYFEGFSKSVLTHPVISLRDEQHQDLRALLEETAEIYKDKSDFSEMLLKGNLYKISAYILKEFNSENSRVKDLSSVSNIENAMELIENNYADDISIEDVAKLTGYSKSNFCKTFKKITGETFHSLLNKHRVKIAGYLLRETSDMVDDIALKVGFPDSKSFCRVFKNITGSTPGQYRKSQK